MTSGFRQYITDSNALANIRRRLIGQRQKFATVYSAIYCWKPDVMSNIAYDWSTLWINVAHAANVSEANAWL